MTCIVGIAQDGHVTLGADSCTSFGGHQEESVDPKIFQRGELLLGCAGYARLGAVLRYRLTLPEHPATMPDHEYVAAELADAVRAAAKETEFALKEDSRIKTECSILLGYRGHVYHMDSLFSALEPAAGWIAIGSGGRVASGALTVLDPALPPAQRIRAALEAAERFDAHVRRPFTILTLPEETA